jgi:hypothetical protein
VRGVPTVVQTYPATQSTPDHGAGSSSLAAQARFLDGCCPLYECGKECLIGHRLMQIGSKAACCSSVSSTLHCAVLAAGP